MVFELDDDVPSQCLLTDDIWDKFQFAHLDLVSLSSELDFEAMVEPLAAAAATASSEIRNHDCMWAGHCGSKEHSMEDVKSGAANACGGGAACRPLTVHVHQPVGLLAPAQKAAAIAPGRSLLLKTQPQLQATSTLDAGGALINAILSYESPPNSDDDEDNKSSVLRYLQDAISECDIDEKDLYDYFEDNKADFMADELADDADDDDDEDMADLEEDEEDDDEVDSKAGIRNEQLIPEEEKYSRSVTISQLVNDHCYFKDQNTSMRNLGIDTPSDSEEEIDVVSTDDKRGVASALPTNPTSRDRHQLQRTMASAIGKTGIRTLLPRKPSSTTTSPPLAKRRANGRGLKRSRHHRLSPTPSPYKKRMAAYQLSSDSEQEPAEKRIEHNNMERQRRIDLRNAFEELRVLVPEVTKRERAPKVIILREAAIYCHQLADVSSTLQRQADEMRRRQRQLRAHLAHLRANVLPRRR